MDPDLNTNTWNKVGLRATCMDVVNCTIRLSIVVSWALALPSISVLGNCQLFTVYIPILIDINLPFLNS